ncbi:hypothetical protein COLO4_06432 [Corchorus olitorius]|uniref:Uncharacterized protein n=1 Tax=Corchorus olitorius TaxID=93759 RepID=A0A1R3KN38_9ROSI|nr:hypothetical protein COLO4_06432 [Corchorus olitorius]
MPCCHANCAIWRIGGEPDNFLDPCYSKETYLRAYQFSLHPITGSHEWKKLNQEKPLPFATIEGEEKAWETKAKEEKGA